MQGKSSKPAAKTPARVSLLGVQPAKGSPFEGISHTNAPARNTRIPNLTEHVTLAKARKQALTHGGLLTPDQQQAASDAGRALAAHKQAKRAASTNSNAAPKSGAALSAKIGNRTQGASPRILPLPSTAPFVVPPRSAPASSSPPPTQPGRRGMQSPRLQLQAAQPKQGSFLGGIPGKVLGAVGSEISASGHDPIGFFLPPGMQQVLHHAGINVTNQAAKIGNEVAPKIQGLGEVAGAINKSQLPAGMAAQFPGQTTVTEDQIRALEASKGKLGNFSQALRDTLIEASVKNGWPREDVVKAVDADLLHYYGNKPANPVLQVAKNFGSFAARQAAGPAGIVAMGDAAVQAAKGTDLGVFKIPGKQNLKPLEKQAQQFVEGSTVGLPFVSPHGMLHDWYWHPGESLQNVSLGVGTADRILGKASRFAPGVARQVTPEGFAAPVSRGELSTRPLQRGIEKARDAYVRSDNPVLNAAVKEHPLLGTFSPVARRTAIAKEAYASARDRSVAPTMAQSNQLRANVMRAAAKVGKERASALNAHLQGLAPEARQAFYEQAVGKGARGITKNRGAAAHAKLSAKHPVTEATLTPNDRQYVDAVRAAAEFSTATRERAGQLSAELSGRYRAYQLPIVAAARQGDELATRTRFLHGEWTKALAQKRTPEELSTIADQFNNALDDFTQRHAEQGGTTPVYIPQEVPQTLTNAFRREASVTATSKVPKLKATQDKLIQSGQYRTTPSGVSLETHRAAVVQARIDHFKAVNEEFATKAQNGAPADPNVVYVKAENLRSPVKLENTVGEHNLTDEQVHSTLDQMRQALESGRVDTTGGYIPAYGDIRAIPKTIYDQLHESTKLAKGAPVFQLYDAANRKYQRFMLSKPSTAGANIVGNPILAMMGGSSPLDVIKGYDIIHNRPETLPPQLMGEGLAGAAGQNVARTPFGKFINFSLSHQRASEDAARAALYHHVTGPYVRKVMEETGASADAILKDLAAGRDANVHGFVKKVEHLLGTMKPSSKFSPEFERGLSRSIMFHRWLGHILTLTLYTMPIKYPGRAVLLQRISEIGDDYRKHHGVYPDWYSSMIPLMQHIANAGGVPGLFTLALPTGSIWPTANLQLPLADSSGASPYGAVINSMNPVLRSVLEAPTGMDFANVRAYKDSTGAQIKPGLGASNLKLGAGQLYRATPYAGVVTPFPGRSADSFPGNMHDAVHKNKYGRPLPAGYGTTAIPVGGNTPSLSWGYLGGLISRLAVGGSGAQYLPANTVGTNYADRAALIKARAAHNKIVSDAAKARAKAKP